MEKILKILIITKFFPKYIKKHSKQIIKISSLNAKRLSKNKNLHWLMLRYVKRLIVKTNCHPHKYFMQLTMLLMEVRKILNKVQLISKDNTKTTIIII